MSCAQQGLAWLCHRHRGQAPQAPRAATCRQTQGTFLISTNAIPTAPLLLGIIHGDGVDVSMPQDQVIRSFLLDPPSSQAPVTVALGLSVRCPKSVDLMSPCLGLPVVDDNESHGHRRRFQASVGCSRVVVTPAYKTPRSPHPSIPSAPCWVPRPG